MKKSVFYYLFAVICRYVCLQLVVMTMMMITKF